ncbi:MAG: DeoR/GlpR family DNA-binding transcription regulator [Terracidiphilus sp.]
MNQFERHSRIRGAFAGKEFISLQELCDLLGASKATVRRDLIEFENSGLLERVHGGAKILAPVKDESLDFKFLSASCPEEKARIGQMAAGLVEDGQTVLLSGGSTALEVARSLFDRPIQIITNSLPVAQVFLDCHHAEVTLTGGYLYPRLGIQIGPVCERMVKGISADIGFLGIRGITESGLSDNNAMVVESLRAMMKSAQRVVVVADRTKFGRNAMLHVAGLDEVNQFISDSQLDPRYRSMLEERGIACLLA